VILSVRGARADSLMGYLKALGLLRLIHEGLDPTVRAAWDDETLLLHTKFDRGTIECFFLDSYAPTPVLNPWNSGAGFDEKSRTKTAGKTLDRIGATVGERWRSYRESIEMSRSIIGAAAEPLEKGDLLTILRDRMSDSALIWLDAAVVVGSETLGFPPLLGSGGNDGRFDFSINFALRALDVVGEERDREISERWLRDALDDTSFEARRSHAPVGQFSPGATGGPNATSGFSADSLSIPWDFVLLIEGTVAFGGSIGKRFGSNTERMSFPFTFETVAAGFGSLSASEETRGEIWLPLWRGAASYPAVLALLRGGRLEIDMGDAALTPRRAARSALEAAQAALCAGAAAGVDRFTRIVMAQRNGLAYAATPAGSVSVREDAAIATLSRSTVRWIAGVEGLSNNGLLGASARAALRAYDEAIFAYGTLTDHAATARALQRAVGALADLDFALAAHPPRSKRVLAPLLFLDDGLYPHLDDGSAEHRIACALASYSHGPAFDHERLRFDIEHVAIERHALRFDPHRVVTWTSDLLTTLGRILERRVRRAIDTSSRIPLEAGCGVDVPDFAAILDGTVDLGRLRRLIAAYALIKPTQRVLRAPRRDKDDHLPAPFSALKVWLHGKSSLSGLESSARGFDVVQPALDPGIVPLLLARQSRAFALVQLRLRTAGFPVRSIAEAELTDQLGTRYAAAALIPASAEAYRAFCRAALLAPSNH